MKKNYTINVDKSFVLNNASAINYEAAVKVVDKFLQHYNDSLKNKINEAFGDTFYFSYHHKFRIDVIFSNAETLINIIKADLPKSVCNIHYSNLNPQIRFLELKNNVVFNPYLISKYPKMFVLKENAYNVIRNWNIVDSPAPFELNKNSFLVTNGNNSIKFNYNNESFFTSFSGIHFLIGSVGLRNFNKQIEMAAISYLDEEISKKFLESEGFRKALIHPKLKEIALQIREKRAEANNNVKEYPWEFENDVNKMKTIAKENNLKDKYVDEMLKDNQYNAVSGTLFFYYADEMSFMKQWVLVNAILLLLISVLSLTNAISNNWVQSILAAVILAINYFIFLKKPDLINIIYWLIPGLIMILSWMLIFFNKILKVIKP